MEAPKFAQLRCAYNAGQGTTVNINGYNVQYAPGMPSVFRAMTNFDANGYALGPGAFSSQEELAKTVFTETYRLNMSVVRGTASADGEVARESAAAYAFADRAYKALGGQ